MFLVDTSIWIHFLRGVHNQKVQFLEDLLKGGDAAICGVVFSEICFGARDEKQFEKYSHYFGTLPMLGLPENWHRELARMGSILRRGGFQPFVADLVISLTAISHQATLLTADSDFEAHRKLLGVNLV